MLNQIVLMGRITKDVEFKETDSYKLARFTVAVDRDRNKDGEKKTDFIRCTAFGSTATFIHSYFDKGSMIAVIGRLQIDVDKTDGYKEYTSVVVDKASFCGEKREIPKEEYIAKSKEPAYHQERIEDTSESRFVELNGDAELPF